VLGIYAWLWAFAFASSVSNAGNPGRIPPAYRRAGPALDFQSPIFLPALSISSSLPSLPLVSWPGRKIGLWKSRLQVESRPPIGVQDQPWTSRAQSFSPLYLLFPPPFPLTARQRGEQS
jgi:hypothetical protein